MTADAMRMNLTPPCALALALFLLLDTGSVSRAYAQGGAKAAPERPESSVSIEKGVLRNHAHGFRFQVLEGWSLAEGVTADEMNFSADGCDECAFRVMVSRGNTLPLVDTVRAIRDQIQKSPGARIDGEEPVKVGRDAAYTIVKEEPKGGQAPPEGAAPHQDSGSAAADAKPQPPAPAVMIRTRYVTFLHGADKYYLLLRAPKARFGSDDAAFEKLLGKFRFESGS